MTASETPATPAYEEIVVDQPDRVARGLRWGIVALVLLILCVVAYALLAGVFSPPAPRTLLESTLDTAEAAIKANPGDGGAWASLAGAQYAGGNTDAAWETLARARKKVKDRSILHVNNRELDFLLMENKNEQAIKRAEEFIRTEADYQVKEKVASAQRGIVVPDQVSGNTESVRLFVMKGTAEGNLGRWEEAVKTFDQALLLTDTAADIVTLRGWARLRAEDPEGAKKDFERALRYMPGDESATRGLEAANEALSADAD